MNHATPHLRTLPDIRWQMLRAIRIAGIHGATEVMLLSALRGLFLQVDQRLIKEQMDYLAARGLVALEQPELEPWWCKLTRTGHDIVDYQTACEPGINRPKKYWKDGDSGEV